MQTINIPDSKKLPLCDVRRLVADMPPLSRTSKIGIQRHVELGELLYLVRLSKQPKQHPEWVRYEFMSAEQQLWFPTQGAGGCVDRSFYAKVGKIAQTSSSRYPFGMLCLMPLEALNQAGILSSYWQMLEKHSPYWRLTEVCPFGKLTPL